MRTHFLDGLSDKTTLCGARILWCGTPNAPRFVHGVENFERINKQNRCIKCDRLLPRLKLKRQKIGEREIRKFIHSELAREVAAVRMTNATGVDLEAAIHGRVVGGPLLGILTNPKEFVEEVMNAPQGE